ncbi:MAG: response regulator transcription factor [Candidatus Paceibacterota bacterium]
MIILIIEDEKKLADVLKRALKTENYSTDCAFDGEEGLQKAVKNNYDLIILDIMLPKKDGVEICRELRVNHIHTPIIMLTAKGTHEDRVIGLNAGADDYLLKPFGMNELFARIRAVLRRRKTTDSDILTISDLIVDRVRHEVTRAGRIIRLTPKEYKLLGVLLNHRGEAISRKRLIDSIWKPDHSENNNELNVHVRYLRRKIDGKGQKPLIHTIRGVGFVVKE